MYTAINDLIHTYVTICQIISMYTAILWPHLISSSDLTDLLPIYSDSSLYFAVIHFHSLNIILSLISNILIKSFNLQFIRQRTLQNYDFRDCTHSTFDNNRKIEITVLHICQIKRTCAPGREWTFVVLWLSTPRSS